MLKCKCITEYMNETKSEVRDLRRVGETPNIYTRVSISNVSMQPAYKVLAN